VCFNWVYTYNLDTVVTLILSLWLIFMIGGKCTVSPHDNEAPRKDSVEGALSSFFNLN
jgi:hypothetical protein